ncbi:MAG: mechanosensitive ion channel family protein [Leptolyngbyaceae cyanobacterium]
MQSVSASLPIKAPVTLGGETLFTIQTPASTASVAVRAQRISDRISTLANNEAIEPSALQTKEADWATLIFAEDLVIMTVTDQDAEAADRARQVLAGEYTAAIQGGVTQYRTERSAEYLAWAGTIAAISTVFLILALFLLRSLTPRFYRWLDREQDRVIPNVHIYNFELLSSSQLSSFLRFLTNLLEWALMIGLILLYVSFVFGLFPPTRQVSQQIFSHTWGAIEGIWQSFLNYLPNLIRLILIIVLTRFFLRFLKLTFTNLRRRRVRIRGFYPEWAIPTYQLLSFLVIALAIAIAFPYLPGANSPAFQGVSLVFGALLSLGATGAISNIVAGFVLVYTRAFLVGDLIQVGDIIGNVEAKQMLAIRVRTLENILVTIPNSSLLNSNITNYSGFLRDKKTPIIAHTTVTLGYDVPWRQVHETLTSAALATPHILHEPAPYVLQTALNDFYVSYQLRAFTKHPARILVIYSELHQNIQDKCNTAGIEICSPHYGAVRDGNQTTIPAAYLPPNYTAPGFRLTSLSDGSLTSPPVNSNDSTLK